MLPGSLGQNSDNPVQCKDMGKKGIFVWTQGTQLLWFDSSKQDLLLLCEKACCYNKSYTPEREALN